MRIAMKNHSNGGAVRANQEQLRKRLNLASVVIAFVGFRLADSQPKMGAFVLFVAGIAYGVGFVVVWPAPKYRALSEHPRFGVMLFPIYLVGGIILYVTTVGLIFAHAPSRRLDAFITIEALAALAIMVLSFITYRLSSWGRT
jgi:hypothetical protein